MKNYTMLQGRIKRYMVKYVKNRSDQLRIVKSCHIDNTSGHFGVKKTVAQIKERFLWKGVWKDAKDVVASCNQCQRMNKNPIVTVTELHPIPVHAPWHHWVEAIPLPFKCSVGVAQALFKILMRMGLPKQLTSDQGGEFRSNFEKQIMSLLSVKRHYITPYHPQANGLDERWNQTLKHMIVKFTSDRKDQWDDFLDTCVYSYNTAKHESTNYTPFELMFGRKANLPLDLDFESLNVENLLNEYRTSEPEKVTTFLIAYCRIQIN
uniref:Integrase catalytic domain-containing protein n=1 Tax=Amphimedon queenslandica TaxID=400682 RepID=A0A1X7VTW9_AMPQE